MRITALLVMAVASLAMAVPVDLYSFDDYQLSASASTTRSQRFSPTESTPNALTAADLFASAAMGIQMQGSDTLAGAVKLYVWNSNYATTKAGAAVASTPINLAGPGGGGATVYWVDAVPAVPQMAIGQYMIELEVTSYSGTTTGWALARSSSNDGGTNNDAFNAGALRTDREYQVRLDVVPEPATLGLLLMAVPALLRKRR